MRRRRWLLFVAAMAGVVTLLLLSPWGGAETSASRTTPPQFGEAFWQQWGDGQAELSGYELVYPRYGEARRGTAVTIFVTETFADSLRVKSERPERPDSDRFPVIKLNLMQDFATGVYDYNLMTSTFVALADVNGRPAGSPTKVAFSSQEWCGQVYAQLLFDADDVRLASHSYFDGEADREEKLAYPVGGVAEDALPLWARGLAGPVLQPGESRDVSLLRSLETARLQHLETAWQHAVLSRAAAPETLAVPAGSFDVERFTVEVAEGLADRSYPPGGSRRSLPSQRWTFWVETAPPRRLVKWTHSSGISAALIASERMAYWTMNGPDFESALLRLGLKPRPPRTP